MVQLLRELDEYQTALLVQDRREILTPKELSAAELRAEVEILLRGGEPAKRLSVAKADILDVQKNLWSLLDQAERLGGRTSVAQEYASASCRDPKEVYKQDKHRYANRKTPGPQELGTRLKLARAACAVIQSVDPAFNESAAILTLLGASSVSYVKFNMETEALLDSAKVISDAWLQLAHALDEELSLSSWFADRTEVIDDAAGLIADLLDVETAACIPDDARLGMPVKDCTATRRLSTPEDAYEDDYNFFRHPHDEALAPSVPLYSFAQLRAAGRLFSDPSRPKSGTRVQIVFWREVMLQLLPGSAGGILPCITVAPKVSIIGASGRPMALATPYSRPLDDPCMVPLLLSKSPHVSEFRPDAPHSFEDQIKEAGLSRQTVFQTAWMASAAVVAIALRTLADRELRPVSNAITEQSVKSDATQCHFANGTVGNVVEKATFVIDRAGGIGGLLRADFYRRDALLRKRGITTNSASMPARFLRSWYAGN
ncbi:hypothetical protein [Mesorhizobium sp. ES1-3]|uniref:hypothetical protein n=1 Tax=Mesorhizobium sp. ES1-3 TaxID=2876628 RepID=UPI001CCBED9D|nr:hypothetical protein [Mesorhizobium sp. ES1-3]MBZ9673795.1 hypothetical protein [Mesorhizobium sp. ES1-3]